VTSIRSRPLADKAACPLLIYYTQNRIKKG
jgi:hypothetical protein